MKIINTGSKYEIYPNDLRTFDELPVQTYKVRFNKFTGFFLEKTDDLELAEGKVYGPHSQKVDKIANSYDILDRSLGVILSGDKGIGKTMTVQLLSNKMISMGVPVIIVDANIPGITDYIDTIKQRAMIVFDEFEKKFPARSDDIVSQEDFLSLFDGMSNQKHLYVITVNDIENLNSYLINRPGRFHYHIRYNYPKRNEIIEYLTDNTTDVSEEEIEKVADFGFQVKLNYDMLRAIALELSFGIKFEEAIHDLNIMAIGQQRETPFVMALTTGEVLEGVTYLTKSKGTTKLEFRYYDDNTSDLRGNLTFRQDRVDRNITGFTVPSVAIVEGNLYTDDHEGESEDLIVETIESIKIESYETIDKYKLIV